MEIAWKIPWNFKGFRYYIYIYYILNFGINDKRIYC
jgi:hypothetical protein